MTAQDENLPTYDCIILSGGGAKGAYGAGAAKAIEAFRKLRNSDSRTCYVGASAGALNACILASGGADELIAFWLQTTNKAILGERKPNAKLRGAFRWAWRGVNSSEPYAIYSNRQLRRLIEPNAKLIALKSPLIVACTDYTRGTLVSFYASPLVEALVEKDATAPVSQQRLAHLSKIETDEMLVDVLLASSAIPVFFPPVRVAAQFGGAHRMSWFVDGGVGNHTPTREAAYFFRFLEQLKLGKTGMAFCITQDPPRTIQDLSSRLDLADILKRTMEVYHNIHTKPIVTAWKRINAEVSDLLHKLETFKNWLVEQPLPEDVKSAILEQVNDNFGRIGGQTPRLGVPLVEIEPSVALGDALDFDPAKARENIVHGFTDTLKTLHGTRDRTLPKEVGKTLLDEAELNILLQADIFRPNVPRSS